MEVNPIEPLVKLSNIEIGYNSDEPLVKIPNLEIFPGEIVAIAGPSGVGKQLFAYDCRFSATNFRQSRGVWCDKPN